MCSADWKLAPVSRIMKRALKNAWARLSVEARVELILPLPFPPPPPVPLALLGKSLTASSFNTFYRLPLQASRGESS